MFELLEHPDYIDRLRDEITQTLGTGGWKKSSLYNLKLMDRVLKETLRVHVPDVATMSRIVQRPVPLSNGTVIPKGARVMVSLDRMHDPLVYPDADKWVGDRFYRMRQQPGGETKGQFVTTIPEHMGFGYGMRACPGRFFAANEIKVALCFLLMNYDWKFSVQGRPLDLVFGTELVANPRGQVLVKRRPNRICAM
ncbi:cytochrome P450 [Botryosphaeria dothidea]|uniref:Cytochrome P450 n=1 Tax=Botryosphaeria dothidea TaxID=55169 RepID=A0A8H4INS1_9PEZI|nr:cytochrome P450 [Botryosphaeria dothidea]